MPYGFVKVGTNSANSNVLSFNPTNNNDFLLLMSQTSAGGGTPTASVADNLTSSYQTAVASTSFSGTSFWWTFFYLPISSTSITTITFTFNGGTPGTCIIAAFEYSGIATSSPFIAASSSISNVTGPGTGSNAIVGPATNVTAVPAMLFGVDYNNNNHTTQAAGTGFTRRDNGSVLLNANMLAEDSRITGVGNANPTWTDATNGGTDQYFAISMAFKEAVADTGIAPTAGSDNFTGNAPTVTPAQNTVIKPFVARKSGLLEPDRRLLVPVARKVFLPTLKQAA